MEVKAVHHLPSVSMVHKKIRHLSLAWIVSHVFTVISQTMHYQVAGYFLIAQDVWNIMQGTRVWQQRSWILWVTHATWYLNNEVGGGAAMETSDSRIPLDSLHLWCLERLPQHRKPSEGVDSRRLFWTEDTACEMMLATEIFKFFFLY